MPSIQMKSLLEAGVHFGHQTRRWNPKMKPYVYGARNGIYIIDLKKTVALTRDAVGFAKKITAGGKKIMFVGTKKQAREIVAQEAAKAGQFSVTNRWLGGTLTNYQTIRASIDRLKKLQAAREAGEFNEFSKKHMARVDKQMQRLEKNLGGFTEMRKLPGALFVIDPSKEKSAILEAKILNIPVIAVVDTNCDPGDIDYVIPGNDDAIKSIRLFVSLVGEACMEGEQEYQEKLRSNQVKEERVEESAAPVSRFEGHIDLETPDEGELALQQEQEEKTEEPSAAAAAATAPVDSKDKTDA